MTDRTNDNNSAELGAVLEQRKEDTSLINVKNEKTPKKNIEKASRNNGEISRTLT